MAVTVFLLAFLGLFESAPAPVEAEIPFVTSPCVAAEPGLAWVLAVRGRGDFTASLFDLSGNLLAGPAASGRLTVTGVRPWSPEDPALYRLVVEDGTGARTALVPFRSTVVKGASFLLNGRVLALKALELPPSADDSEPTMREEIRLAKAANCNAVGPGLHGNSPLWRRLCLENGLYVARPNDPLTRRICRGEADLLRIAYDNRAWSVKATNYFQRVVVENRNVFADATDVTLGWTALRDGRPFADGTFDLRGLGPGAECVFEMPDEVVAARGDAASLFIRFAFRSRGETVAEDQIDLVESRSSEALLARPVPRRFFFGGRVAPAAYSETDEEFAFESGAARVVFSKVTGQLVAYARKGLFGSDELLSRGFALDVCRPSRAGVDAPFAAALAQGLRCPVAELLELSPVDEIPGGLTFATRVEWRGWRAERLDAVRGGPVDAGEVAGEPVRFEVAARWTVCPDGTVACRSRVRRFGPEADLPRVGWSFALADGDTDVEWFGRGPRASAPHDAGAFLGRWTLGADGFGACRGLSAADFRSEVRGFAAGGLAVRTLAAPFAFAVAPDEDGSSLRVVFSAEGPAACADEELAFTLEPFRGALTARVYDGDLDLPELTARPHTDGKEQQ